MDAVGSDHKIESSKARRARKHLDLVTMLDDLGDGGARSQRQVGGGLPQDVEQVGACELADDVEAADRLGKIERLHSLAMAVA